MAPQKKALKKSEPAKTKNAKRTPNKRDSKKKEQKKREPEKHGYNLRRRHSSCIVVQETCECTESERKKLHSLHLHSARCQASSRAGQCNTQSKVSIISISSEDSEADAEAGEAGGNDETQSQGGQSESGDGRDSHRQRAAGEVTCMVHQPMSVETPALNDSHTETDGTQSPAEEPTSLSACFLANCAATMSEDLEQEGFRPLCASTPEGKIWSPRPAELPAASAAPDDEVPPCKIRRVISETRMVTKPANETQDGPSGGDSSPVDFGGHSATNHQTSPAENQNGEPPFSSARQGAQAFFFGHSGSPDFAGLRQAVGQEPQGCYFFPGSPRCTTGSTGTSDSTSRQWMSTGADGTGFYFGPRRSMLEVRDFTIYVSPFPNALRGNPTVYEFGASGNVNADTTSADDLNSDRQENDGSDTDSDMDAEDAEPCF